ncbi:hypothetical protein NGM37_23365 [Streptomyces sp. TRM76130]|nr:hypothetical protein [Streptomyces sp. TRM76130]
MSWGAFGDVVSMTAPCCSLTGCLVRPADPYGARPALWTETALRDAAWA